jgi:hypothetical protein
MPKKPVADRRRARSGAGVGSGGVTIASGAHVPKIDLDLLFRGGGGVQAPATFEAGARPVVEETIALRDGTRITFATAARELETV